MMGGALVYDIETELNPAKVHGGWKEAVKGKAGMSVAVVHNPVTGVYHVFGRRRVLQLAMHLQSATIICGHNIVGFDDRIVQALSGAVVAPPRFDLLQELSKTTGSIKGWSMDRIARAMLGRRYRHMWDGQDMPHFWKMGLYDRVMEHCLNDVRQFTEIMRMIVRRHGRVTNGDADASIDVSRVARYFR